MKGYSLDNESIQNNFKKLYLLLTDTYDRSSSACQYGQLTFRKAYFRKKLVNASEQNTRREIILLFMSI
jgi:hypothetical protein